MAATGDATVLDSGETTLMASGDTIPKIATYVFFDLESTDLLHARTRITELCLVAVNRVDMQAPGTYPRVTNKLTLCFDPLKPIAATASSITGLYNDSLENQKPFTTSTVQLLRNFLENLQQPVCLLAHYGNGFDFPLLKQELQRINQSLDCSVLCADTLEAFRSLDGVEPGIGLPLCLCAMCSELRESHNYTPFRNHTIPTPNTPVKRKIDKQSDDNINLKKLNQQDEESNGSSERVRQGAAVKKRLDFQASESQNVIYQKTSNNTESDNNYTKASSVKKRLFDDSNQAVCNENLEERDFPDSQFSASIEDIVYLEALEEIEKKLAEDIEDIEDISESKDTMIPEEGNDNEDINKSTEILTLNQVDDQVSKNLDSVGKSNNEYTTKSKYSVIQYDPVSSSSGYIMKSSDEVLDSTCMRREAVYKSSPVESRLSSTTLYTLPEVFNVPQANTEPKSMESAPKNSTDVRLTTDVRGNCLTPVEQNVSSSHFEDDKNRLCKSSISSASDSTVQTVNVSHAEIKHSCVISSASDSCVSSTAEPVTCDSHVINVENRLPNTFSNSNSSPSACGASAANNNSIPKRHSYKLEEIHKRVLGEKPTRSHCAEDDCIAMVKIAKCTRGFMEWVDSHAQPLSSI